jgi:hypothetical protein
MRKSFVFFPLLLIGFILNAQKSKPEPFSRDYYLQKSAKANKTGRILLIAGGASLVIGILIPRGPVEEDFWFYQTYQNDGVKSAFAAVGLLSMIASLPAFIVGTSNNKKAKKATVSVGNQTIYLAGKGLVIPRQPTLTLKVPL